MTSVHSSCFVESLEMHVSIYNLLDCIEIYWSEHKDDEVNFHGGTSKLDEQSYSLSVCQSAGAHY